MKTVVSLPAVLGLVPALMLASACAHKVNDPADVQTVTQTVEAFAKAMYAGDMAVARGTWTIKP